MLMLRRRQVGIRANNPYQLILSTDPIDTLYLIHPVKPPYLTNLLTDTFNMPSNTPYQYHMH